jgi:feruloyl esterase
LALACAPEARAALPARSCASLATLTSELASDGLLVKDSHIVSAGRVPESEKLYEPSELLPEHCLLHGSFGSRVGVGGRSYELRFELRMPTNWNGRFLFEGGGDLDGVDWPAYGSLFGRLSPTALARGFAVVRTNSGHTSPTGSSSDATFAVDQQARIDYGFSALDRVTLEAKKIVDIYYGRQPAHSYFVGCSNGGRQAMEVTERFPLYFDGVVSGDPSFDISHLAPWMVQNVKVLSRIAPKDANGHPILSKAFSDTDLKLVLNTVMKQCDALDGLKDGMINDMAGCHFDPGILTCRGPKTPSCLTQDQVTAMSEVMQGPLDEAGRPIYRSFPYDAGFAQGWRVIHLGTSATAVSNSFEATMGLVTLQYHSLTPPDPRLDPLTFSFPQALARVEQTAAMNDADWTFLDTFAAHGKLILYQGMSDYGLSANQLAAWYDRLHTDTGGHTEDWARLFLVPGMGHCDGGPSTDQFDPLAAIVSWVEHGKAPDRIIATGKHFPGESRPLCPWPKVARYVGGDTHEAQSFACR